MSATRSGVCKPLLVFFFLLGLYPILTFAQTPALVVAPVDNAVRVTLNGNVHPLARPEFDRGAVAGSQPMTRILLLLKRSEAQEAALQSFMEQQQDKSSPNYHQWLTPAEFGAQYGPADSDVQAVTQWLTSQGFTVAKVYSSKMMIEFSGTAAQVQAAFGTPIHNYEVSGKTYVANVSDPQIPAALAPVVAGVVSLNNFPRQSHVRIAGQARKIAGQSGLQPEFTFPNPFTGSGSFYGVGPADFATIYNSKGLVASGNDGTGQTIAIVGETDINVADVQAFRQMFNLSSNFTSANIILNGEDPGITSSDEEGEADLDTQWSGAVAPGATIKFVVSASTPASQGIDLSALYIIEYNLAGVMSESYGGCESSLGTAGNAFYNSLWEQAATQGITVVLSAGDGGSAGCDNFITEQVATQGLAVSGLASTPYNVALGGTDFDQVDKWVSYWSSTNNAATGLSALSYIPEIPRSNNCAQTALAGCGATAPQGSLNIVAGSGGASSTYVKPKWQMGVSGMPNDNQRDVPDVSLFASSGFDMSAYVICAGTGQLNVPATCTLAPNNYQFAIVGGTSASAPAFAGIMALVNQYQSAHGGSARQGNPNYVLYSLAKKSGASCTSSSTESASCIFNDITHGNSMLPVGAAGVGTNSVPCLGGSPNCSVAVATENGVLVEPTNSKVEAWTVGAGYDLATGLGSVNINNLATNWGSVNSVATTTTLTLNPTTGITHGTAENVTVNITVTPKTGTATGDVSLIATIAGPNGATTQGLEQFTLNSSGQVVNATTNSLPGGTSYQVYAHYAGDGTNAPSDSSPVTVTVGKEISQTFIVVPTFDSSGNQTNGNATSVPYGSNYYIRMYATDKNAVASPVDPPAPACYQENQLTCPTGTVSLTDNGNALGTGGGGAGIYNLNVGGYTRNLTPNLTTGSHSLIASYSGDNSYLASTVTVPLTVSPAPTSITEQVMGNIFPGDITFIADGVPFQVAVNGTVQTQSGVAPTGTVTFLDGKTQLGSPYTVAGSAGQNGTSPAFSVNPTITISTAGSHTLVAQYSGDSNYAPSSTSTVVNVLHHTVATISVTPTAVNYGGSVTITGTIDTSVPASNTALQPTGTVKVYGTFDEQSAPGITTTAATDANGNWELQVSATATPSMSEPFMIAYMGDSNYGPSLAGGGNVTVSLPDFTMTPNPSSLTLTTAQTASVSVSVTPLTNQNSTVALVCMDQIIGVSCSISPASLNLANSAPSTATVTLSALGSSSTGTIASVRKRRSLAVPIQFRMNRGGPFLFISLLLLTLVSILQIMRRRYRLGLSIASIGVVVLMLGCGSGGGGGGNGGGSPVTTSVSIASSATKVTTSNSPNVTLTATVTSSQPVTGTITFWETGNDGALGPSVTLVNGTATEQVALYQVGINQIYAQYSGDSKNQGSQSPFTNVISTGSGNVQIQGTSATLFRYTNVSVNIQ
jgi:subtilase family serine protease